MSTRDEGCAVVTGGTRGIGAAVADALRERGWNVATLSRNGADLQADVSRPRGRRARVRRGRASASGRSTCSSTTPGNAATASPSA